MFRKLTMEANDLSAKIYIILGLKLEKEMANHSSSCLENPRDREAWRAAIYGVAQSRTLQKRLSSSSSRPKTRCSESEQSGDHNIFHQYSDEDDTSLLLLFYRLNHKSVITFLDIILSPYLISFQ